MERSRNYQLKAFRLHLLRLLFGYSGLQRNQMFFFNSSRLRQDLPPPVFERRLRAEHRQPLRREIPIRVFGYSGK